MKLILVRHGKPEFVLDSTSMDPPLSEEGKIQAERVGRFLADVPIDAIVHSGLVRARATAQPLVDRLGLSPRVVTDIGEIDRYGIHYSNPEIVRALGKEEWIRFLGDPIGYYGIDEARFRAETIAAFAEMLTLKNAKTVVVFTHGFPINILLAQALGIKSIAHFLPVYGSVTRIAGSSIDRLSVISVNETAYLMDRYAEKAG